MALNLLLFLAERGGAKDEFVEGDIKNEGPVKSLKSANTRSAVLKDQNRLWPDATVPYVLDGSLSIFQFWLF